MLEDMRRVGFDTVQEVIIGRVEQFIDGWHVIAAVAKPFPAMKQRVESRTVSS